MGRGDVVELVGSVDRDCCVSCRNVIEEALEMAFEEVDRPELYQRTREERGLDPLPPVADGNPHCYGIV